MRFVGNLNQLRKNSLPEHRLRSLETVMGPTTTRETEQMSGKIKLYALSTCRHCKNVKRMLADCGVKYECADIDKLPKEEVAPLMEELRKISAGCAFPTIVIGDRVIVGCKEDEIMEALGT